MDENGRCAILAPVRDFAPVACGEQLRELERRGYVVHRLGGWASLSVARNQMAADALVGGFDELLWIDPDVVFVPADVERLRRRRLPMVGGVVGRAGEPQPAEQFASDAGEASLGGGSALQELQYAKLSFMLTRRDVFERIQRVCKLPVCKGRDGTATVPYFLPMVVENTEHGSYYLYEDYAFCERARSAGVPVLVDPSAKFWRLERNPTKLATALDEAGAANFAAATSSTIEIGAPPRRAAPPRNSLQSKAAPLSDGFPRLRAYVATYHANLDSARRTAADFEQSDWGETPELIIQDAALPTSRDSAGRNYRQALDRAASDCCDFALIVEDDVRVAKHLRHNLTTLSLVRRDQCDFLSLYMPDLIQAPWVRQEPQLGYRLARPLYFGPEQGWQKYRLWGSQAYLLSRRLVLAALAGWDDFPLSTADTMMMRFCGARSIAMWYTAPSLVQHAPMRSCFGTPLAYAADFDPDFKLGAPKGCQPPEGIPGWLSVAEGRLLAEWSDGLSALELGTGCGRATVCIAQTARRLTTIDSLDQSEAMEWARRFEVTEKVRFLRGDAAERCATLEGPFEMIYIDGEHDAESIARDIDAAAPLLARQGLLAFRAYPDPDWPDVRRMVDEHARQRGWRRIAQVDYLGVFRT